MKPKQLKPNLKKPEQKLNLNKNLFKSVKQDLVSLYKDSKWSISLSSHNLKKRNLVTI